MVLCSRRTGNTESCRCSARGGKHTCTVVHVLHRLPKWWAPLLHFGLAAQDDGHRVVGERKVVHETLMAVVGPHRSSSPILKLRPLTKESAQVASFVTCLGDVVWSHHRQHI